MLGSQRNTHQTVTASDGYLHAQPLVFSVSFRVFRGTRNESFRLSGGRPMLLLHVQRELVAPALQLVVHVVRALPRTHRLVDDGGAQVLVQLGDLRPLGAEALPNLGGP